VCIEREAERERGRERERSADKPRREVIETSTKVSGNTDVFINVYEGVRQYRRVYQADNPPPSMYLKHK
jgi:hypothetical protein